MKLIQEWRHAWRLWSVRLNLMGLVLLVAEQALPMWGIVPIEARSFVPRWIGIGLPILCFVLGTVARVIRQGGSHHGGHTRRP